MSEQISHVALVDLLGYATRSNMMSITDLEEMENALNEAVAHAKGTLDTLEHLLVRDARFSDTFILTVTCDAQYAGRALMALCLTIQRFVATLQSDPRCRFLTRGAIASGKLIAVGNSFAGPAINIAAKIYEDAVGPFVVLDEIASGYAVEYAFDFLERFIRLGNRSKDEFDKIVDDVTGADVFHIYPILPTLLKLKSTGKDLRLIVMPTPPGHPLGSKIGVDHGRLSLLYSQDTIIAEKRRELLDIMSHIRGNYSSFIRACIMFYVPSPQIIGGPQTHFQDYRVLAHALDDWYHQLRGFQSRQTKSL